MKKVYYLILSVIFFSCKNSISQEDLKYVKENTWQWDKGFKIAEGEFVSFDKNSLVYKLSNDTIYYHNIPTALIKKINKKYYELTVSSIDGKSKGVYINIEEFTK